MVLSSFVVQVFCLFFLIIENTLPQVVRIEGYASVAECDTRETLTQRCPLVAKCGSCLVFTLNEPMCRLTAGTEQ